ncbi:MAG: phenylalanine--tRNA ligase subunit alpha [Clostridiales bacterium]|nr:phenylalanine--tRNA ligase subunit alpha [Clostridiales bacterium]
MEAQLRELQKNAEEEIAVIDSLSALEDFRIKYLGKKGNLTLILRGMGKLTKEERPIVGGIANQVREYIENIIEKKSEILNEKELKEKLSKEKIDVTMPAKRNKRGNKHPLTKTIDEIKNIFIEMGYEIADGPEIETNYYNFDALNIPKDHPARDTQDTFYINDDFVLRTATSPVQIRIMENRKPPIKIISPGKVYRSDEVDATHSPIFHQIEGLVVDKNVTMGDLIGTIEVFAKKLFGEDTKIRLRPHYFPFTEPSAEFDVSCWNCKGEGCRTCKDEGFIEILGAGMVHPNVLKICGIDPNEYSGFAFGLGVERTTMGRYNIDDIRLFYENDVRFLEQF